MQAGREPDDQQPVPDAAERRHRAAVIARLPRAHLIEEPGEPRTLPAGRIEWRSAPASHGALSAS
jgi:hypothetical protein